MKLYVFKLSNGLYYRSGYSTGQPIYRADIYRDDKMDILISQMLFVKDCIDANVQLTEIVMKEK
jgi:hypothetical protein